MWKGCENVVNYGHSKYTFFTKNFTPFVSNPNSQMADKLASTLYRAQELELEGVPACLGLDRNALHQASHRLAIALWQYIAQLGLNPYDGAFSTHYLQLKY